MPRSYTVILIILLVAGSPCTRTVQGSLIAQETPLSKGEPVTEATSILTAPLRTGGNNLFHSLILIPPLETAERIGVGKTYLQSGLDYATGNLEKERKDWLVNYDAHLFEGFIDLRHGFSKAIEFKASLTGGILAGEKELLLLEGNTGYIAGERGWGLSDLIIGGKFRITESSGDGEDFPYTSALGVWLKKPLADKKDLLSSGGTDLAIAYLETDQLDEETFVHTQIGYTLTGKARVFREDLKVSNTLFYGLGISWRVAEEIALIGQIQGNLNAFKEVRTLTNHPLNIQVGFRYGSEAHSFTEAGIGFGLNNASADFTLLFSAGRLF